MRDKYKLALITGLALFLEMALVRYIPANVILTGYFANLALLGAFLGLGLGMMLVRKVRDITGWWPLLLLLLLFVVIKMKISVDVTASNVIFFKNVADATSRGLPPVVVLPGLFAFVAMMFFPLGQAQGKIMEKFEALTAYAWDIGGAIGGVMVFFVMSLLSVPAWGWFVVVLGVAIIILDKKPIWLFGMSISALVAVIVLVGMADRQSIWSPYYKIDVGGGMDSNIGKYFVINVNNMSHQFMSDYKKREAFYFAPYDVVANPVYKKVLIIGAGSGMDVATVLGENPKVEEIDAVEIDPKIYEIGKELNMNHPYDDPRVNVIIDDGRDYLARTSKKYDLIIFALTDSLAITGSSANVRLESFLFTKESFELARQKLSDNGLFVLYNYYRKKWLVDKIALTLTQVFGKPPYAQVYESVGQGAVFLAGPKTQEIITTTNIHTWNPISNNVELATDSWPFVYMRNKEIPAFYAEFLGVILLFAFIVSLTVYKMMGGGQIEGRFFWLGVGFMLLETKSLTTFGLLFGTTWMVNCLAVLAILTSVFLANWVNSLGWVKNLRTIYLALAVMLFLGVILPPSMWLGVTGIFRYLGAAVVYFSPVFLANLIFSGEYKNTKENATSLGMNMLGSMLGGVLEYSSLVLGYRLLGLLIAGCYGLSLFKSKRK